MSSSLSYVFYFAVSQTKNVLVVKRCCLFNMRNAGEFLFNYKKHFKILNKKKTIICRAEFKQVTTVLV